MSRFGKALGVWEIDIEEVKLELKPTMADVKLFRNILVNEDNTKNKQKLFEKFSDFMASLCKAQYPEDPENEAREWIEVNLINLFNEAMIAFKWTTKEDLEQSKKESLADLKKQMSSV